MAHPDFSALIMKDSSHIMKLAPLDSGGIKGRSSPIIKKVLKKEDGSPAENRGRCLFGRMRLYLVRHGETDWNLVRRLQGSEDIPLNAYGRELAAATAEALKDISFDAVFCSPLSRAKETAEIITGERKVQIQTDDRLKEIGFGIGEGRNIPEIRNTPGDPLHDFFYAPERFIPMEGGETFEEVYARTADVVREKILPLEATCGNVLVVAHGVANRSILNPAAGIPMEEFWKIPLLNCTVSVLEVKNGILRVLEEGKTYY